MTFLKRSLSDFTQSSNLIDEIKPLPEKKQKSSIERNNNLISLDKPHIYREPSNFYKFIDYPLDRYDNEIKNNDLHGNLVTSLTLGTTFNNPLSSESQDIEQTDDVGFRNNFNGVAKNGEIRYKNYYQALNDPNELPDNYKITNVWDSMALVLPGKLYGLRDKLEIYFGNQVLQEIAGSFETLSLNAKQNILVNIPSNYTNLLTTLPDRQFFLTSGDNYKITGLSQVMGVYEFPILVPKDLTNQPTIEELQDAIQLSDNSNNFIRNLGQQLNSSDIFMGIDESKGLESNLPPKIIDKYYEKIYNLPQYLSWLTKQIDATNGMFPIELEIEDTDLIKIGNQTQVVTIPNIAECLAEIVGTSIKHDALLDLLVNISMRNLQETASTRQTSIVASYDIQSIQEYLGYEIKQKVIKVPFTFNPIYNSVEPNTPDNDIQDYWEQALEPTEISIKIDESVEENTLEQKLLQIGTHTARASASVFRKTSDFLELKNQLLDEYKAWKGNDNDLNDTFEKIENEYNLDTKPYGKDDKFKPKITLKNTKGGNKSNG